MIVIVLTCQYIKNCDFELENLVNAGYTSHHMDVVNLMKKGSLAANRIKNENTLMSPFMNLIECQYFYWVSDSGMIPTRMISLEEIMI